MNLFMNVALCLIPIKELAACAADGQPQLHGSTDTPSMTQKSSQRVSLGVGYQQEADLPERTGPWYGAGLQ